MAEAHKSMPVEDELCAEATGRKNDKGSSREHRKSPATGSREASQDPTRAQEAQDKAKFNFSDSEQHIISFD
jgi:hypothetical protein